MKTEPIQFTVGDMIETPGFTGTRLYFIDGIHIGATGQENVIEISPVDRINPTAHAKMQSMFVPMEMLDAGIRAGIYTYTQS